MRDKKQKKIVHIRVAATWHYLNHLLSPASISHPKLLLKLGLLCALSVAYSFDDKESEGCLI
jgi:hypothetical protein